MGTPSRNSEKSELCHNAWPCCLLVDAEAWLNDEIQNCTLESDESPTTCLYCLCNNAITQVQPRRSSAKIVILSENVAFIVITAPFLRLLCPTTRGSGIYICYYGTVTLPLVAAALSIKPKPDFYLPRFQLLLLRPILAC